MNLNRLSQRAPCSLASTRYEPTSLQEIGRREEKEGWVINSLPTSPSLPRAGYKEGNRPFLDGLMNRTLCSFRNLSSLSRPIQVKAGYQLKQVPELSLVFLYTPPTCYKLVPL